MAEDLFPDSLRVSPQADGAFSLDRDETHVALGMALLWIWHDVQKLAHLLELLGMRRGDKWLYTQKNIQEIQSRLMHSGWLE